MRCFLGDRSASGRRREIPATPRPPSPPAAAAAAASATEDENDDDDEADPRRRRRRRRDEQSPSASSGTQTSTATSSVSTINLTQEYALAVQTLSYNEIRSKIFHHDDAAFSSGELIARVLHPDRASIDEALRLAPPTPISRLACRYFETSELTTHLCLSLHRAVARSRSLYAPVSDLLDLLPPSLSPAQSEFAFDKLLQFSLHLDNPFPAPAAVSAFRDMRLSFADLRCQLDLRLTQTRRRHRLLRRATRASAACLIASTVAVTVAAVALATHALVALVATPAVLLGIPKPPTKDLLAGPRRRLRERMSRLDAAGRGAYVLNNDLDTVERLVAKLHAAVESDRALVRIGLERGKGQRQLIEEVLRHLRTNYRSFLRQLKDLDEHVCLCFAAVNRARSLLLHHIYHSTSAAVPDNGHPRDEADSNHIQSQREEAEAAADLWN